MYSDSRPNISSPLPAMKAGPHLSRLCLSCLLIHFSRQQVRKAMDISRMTAQLTMEAITATLNPKSSKRVRAEFGDKAKYENKTCTVSTFKIQ